MARSDVQSLVSDFISRLEVLIRRDILTRTVAVFGRGTRRAKSGRPTNGASAGRRLQGRYIGGLRSLKGEARRRVQAVARKDGVAAALELLDRLRRR
jgi:hypothetical protein